MAPLAKCGGRVIAVSKCATLGWAIRLRVFFCYVEYVMTKNKNFCGGMDD
jgi:hypothetical protein